MKLGEFIKNFSHNNLIRLWYEVDGGYQTFEGSYNNVSMDWEINKQKGIFRHYVNNEVIGLKGICFDKECHYPEAINIVIEKLENQPQLPDLGECNGHVKYAEAL